MKNLTTEEKAKAYDEALEIARKINSGEGVPAHPDWSICEVIFPELKESEEEKARKWIYDYIRNCPNESFEFYGGIGKKAVLAYLEKQKEPDGIWTEEDDAKVKAMCKEGDLKPSERAWLKELKNRIVKKEQKPTPDWMPKFLDELRTKSYLDWDEHREMEGKVLAIIRWIAPNYFDAEQKEQKPYEPKNWPADKNNLTQEQKPTEWSEEDEYKLNFLTKMLDGLDQREFDTKYMKELSSWLKSFLERFNLQPKNEWTEKDKHRCKDAIYFLETAKKHYADTSEIELTIEWLKSLRPQPKKELSIEKAIKWLDDTFYFLDNSSGRGRDCEITTHDFDSLEEMYDSFRKAVIVDSEPHWKPSEEQMEWLKDVIETVTMTCRQQTQLESLYTDLQKLL